jgi:signal transduction histidine kinase
MLSRGLRWRFVIVPALTVGGIELLSDTVLDPYLPFPWDTILVTLVVGAIAAVLSRLAFARMDHLTAALEARNAEVEARASTASALHAVSLAIASLSELDAILQAIVDSARSLIRADLAMLVLAELDGSTSLRASSGPAGAFDPAGTQQGDEVRRFVRDHATGAILAAPLRRGQSTIGNLVVVGPSGLGPEVRDVETLSSLATQAALALENDRLATELRRTAIQHERERIADEIHDGLAQVLGYVNTKSQAVEGLLEAGRVDEARLQMIELAAAARSIYVDVREAIAGLAEPADESLDFETQVRDYAARFANSAKVAVTVTVTAPDLGALPTPVRDEVVAIVREALTNVRKHAAAGRVTVVIEPHPGGIGVVVADDGRGFEPARAGGGSGDWPHYGITAMRRRASAIGGTVEWMSAPGAGCRVELTVPLQLAGATSADARRSTPTGRV